MIVSVIWHQELLEKQYKCFTLRVKNCGENREHFVSQMYDIFSSIKVQFNWLVNLCEGIMDISQIFDMFTIWAFLIRIHTYWI